MEITRGWVDLALKWARTNNDLHQARLLESWLECQDDCKTLVDALCRSNSRAEAAEARVAIAEDLLRRVVIHGGSGSWTWREMYDWCCDYKDWSNGGGRESRDRPHDNCGHRSRSGTDCGAIGAGDSDDLVPPIFGPDGLLKQAQAAEAEVRRYRELLTLPGSPLRQYPDGGTTAEVSTVKVGRLVDRAEAAEARVAELERVAAEFIDSKSHEKSHD